jgi:hypothetical protein
VKDIKMPATIDDPATLDHIKLLAGEWLENKRKLAAKAALAHSALKKQE